MRRLCGAATGPCWAGQGLTQEELAGQGQRALQAGRTWGAG